jgi:5'-nucleotidase / UDP-sugar diphosphatase
MLLSVLLGCTPRAVEPPAAQAGELVLLHTNDLHGHYLDEDGDGGLVLLDAYADAYKAAHPVLMLDAGDVLSGTPLTDLEVRGAQGGAMMELMEAVGYDAWALGNHEFDKGQANTQAIVSASNIPVLSANLRRGEAIALDGLLPHIILEENGLRVGVIGLVTEALDKMVSPRMVEGITVEPSARAVEREIEAMGPVDLVVVLSHIGLEEDRALAARVPEIDLIVGGHSHSFVHRPELVGDTWVVQAGEYAKVLGVLKLQVEDGAITSFQGELVQLTAAGAPGQGSDDVQNLVQLYDGHIREVYDVALGTATGPLVRDYYHQSSMGGWATGMIQTATGADVGIYNSGGLREDLPAGVVTRRSLYQVFPFSNAVVTFEITGDELTSLVLANCFRELEGRSWMQMSGVQAEWRVRLDSPELLSVLVNGEPLAPERTYVVATNSYVLDQAPRMLSQVDPKKPTESGFTVLDAAVWAAEAGPITPPATDTYVRR